MVDEMMIKRITCSISFKLVNESCWTLTVSNHFAFFVLFKTVCSSYFICITTISIDSICSEAVTVKDSLSEHTTCVFY